MMPSQKFGVEMPNSAAPFAAQSAGVSFFTAERMPSGTPINTAMTKAIDASWKVTGSLARMSSLTGTRMRQEKPKSPVSTLPIQIRYCSWMGRSRPSSARIAASTAGSPRSSPARISAGSPGMSCCSPKIRKERIRRVGITCPTLRSSQMPTYWNRMP